VHRSKLGPRKLDIFFLWEWKLLLALGRVGRDPCARPGLPLAVSRLTCGGGETRRKGGRRDVTIEGGGWVGGTM
jgi:hypothetical protein